MSTEWMSQAACVGLPTNSFFPRKGKHGEAIEAVRSICQACPVRDQCLEFALSFPNAFDAFGIFGGTTANERRTLRSETQAGTAPDPTYGDVFADFGAIDNLEAYL